MDFACISYPGDRPVNEDYFTISENKGNYCFTVCDGLGGHAKGETASKTVSEAFKEEFKSYDGNSAGFFEKAFNSAAKIMNSLANESPVLELMKTTVVSLIIIEDKCRWAHIGDSRLYGFSANRTFLCTFDHSVPEMLVKSGKIKQREIRNHPDRNKLLRAFGVSEELPQYETGDEMKLSDYDAFLLCTDGFWELINEKKAAGCLKRSQNASQWLEEMTKHVKRKGRRRNMDNYTAVAVILKKGGK